jgi:hypothetical protein
MLETSSGIPGRLGTWCQVTKNSGGARRERQRGEEREGSAGGFCRGHVEFDATARQRFTSATL